MKMTNWPRPRPIRREKKQQIETNTPRHIYMNEWMNGWAVDGGNLIDFLILMKL